MDSPPSRGHYSIGEVVSLLGEEHPELTISKIRFLENEGLLEPERTPSGYRRFYQGDVERLRWILTQQRDHQMPLKVIRRKIQEWGAASASELAGGDGADRADGADEPDSEHRRADGRQPVEGSVSLTTAELSAAANASAELIGALVRFGLIRGRETAAGTVFDHEALIVARAASAFAERGVEARHLRMFKIAVERESGLYEQILAPLILRGRNDEAGAELSELVNLAETIRRSLLRRILGPRLG